MAPDSIKWLHPTADLVFSSIAAIAAGRAGAGDSLTVIRIRAMNDAIISEARTSSEFVEARRLFEEYAAALSVDLSFQDFAQELVTLRDMYSPPTGCLLLARRNGTPIGCVALRKFRGNVCEMKRLFVQSRARGRKLGKALTERVIERARECGYKRMVLDTLESMESARRLYRSVGFRETSPYYENPIDGAVYMELDLTSHYELL